MSYKTYPPLRPSQPLNTARQPYTPMTARRRKKQSYIWLGIKGFFKLIWIGIKYIGIGFYYIGKGIGWCVHSIASKLRIPRFRDHMTGTDPAHPTDNTTADAAHTTSSTHAKAVPAKKHGELPAQYEDITPHQPSEVFTAVADSLYAKSQIALIFGKRGSGKSTLGFRIMENAHALKERPCFVLGVKQSVLPSWISEVSDIEQTKNGGIVLVDEGAIAFSARQSMKKSNVELGKLLAVARHKDLTVLFITQNTGMIDKNVLNLTDIIIAKEGSLLQ